MKKIKRINKVKLPLVRPCPCAIDHISCGYYNISHILGCPYNCSYCFLHSYYGKDEIVVYDNDVELLRQTAEFLRKQQTPCRVGTGQYSDSLALDLKTGMSKKLIELFARQDKHLLELKTKSANVDHLLGLNHNRKTVIAWSVNPQKIVANNEHGAVSLSKRLQAAKKCAKAGYPVAFHFDPIIAYDGWDKDYAKVVDLIFELPDKAIAWISLGALRYKQNRYPEEKRIEIFNEMASFIRQHSFFVYLYLCMENKNVWQKTQLSNCDPANNPYIKLFSFSQKS